MATATDDFNRTNDASLGANWTVHSGSLGTNGTQAKASDANSNSVNAAGYKVATVDFTDNQSSEVTVSGMNAVAGAAVIVQAKGLFTSSTFGCYYYIVRTTSSSIGRYVNNTPTHWQTGLAVAANGDVIKLTLEGATLRAYKNGVQQGVDQDVSAIGLSAGQPGFLSSDTDVVTPDARFDDWTGADVGGGGGGGATTGFLSVLGVG